MNNQHPNQGRAKPFFDKMSKVETDECILWQFGISWNGYGQLTVNGKTRRVHRLALQQRGIISPPGKPIAGHTCHTRHCFNYRHLKWISNKENMEHKIKDNTRQIGENNVNSKLTKETVIFIRNSTLPQRELARMFGVRQSTINDARLGKTWSWV